MSRLTKLIALTGGSISCIFLLVNITDIAAGIISRQFGNGIVWTEELARVSLVWCVMIGSCAALYEGDNMSVDFAVRVLPEWGRVLCRLVSFAIECVVLCVLVYYGSINVMGGWTMRSMALHIPRAIPLMSVPVGIGLLLAVLIGKFIEGRRNV